MTKQTVICRTHGSTHSSDSDRPDVAEECTAPLADRTYNLQRYELYVEFPTPKLNPANPVPEIETVTEWPSGAKPPNQIVRHSVLLLFIFRCLLYILYMKISSSSSSSSARFSHANIPKLAIEVPYFIPKAK